MNLSEQIELAWRIIPIELLNTLYMVFTSAFVAFLLALPLAVFLYLSKPNGLRPRPLLYVFLNLLVNIGRSLPFAILMVAVIPFTRWVVGTSIGTTASMVPLTLAAAPFLARVLEEGFRGVDLNVIAAAQVMGSSTSQIVRKVLLPEALPAIIGGATLTVVTLIGYSAMAGLIGGGGLGKVAIQYGYQRFNGFIMLVTVILLVLLVEAVQWVGNRVQKKILRKWGV